MLLFWKKVTKKLFTTRRCMQQKNKKINFLFFSLQNYFNTKFVNFKNGIITTFLYVFFIDKPGLLYELKLIL